jgi:hypothetical protein
VFSFLFIKKIKYFEQHEKMLGKESMETFLMLPFYPIFAALKIK